MKSGQRTAVWVRPSRSIEPEALTTPVVFNSPAFRAPSIRAAFLRAFAPRPADAAPLGGRVRRRTVRCRCVALGAPLLRARFPRAYLDVNREPYELDPQMFEGRLPDFANTRSLRVAAGLGSIPRVVGEAQPIYRQPIAVAEGLARIEALHQPYHAELAALIERRAQQLRARDPDRLPFDALGVARSRRAATSCSATASAPARRGWIVDALEASLRASGLAVRRNKPYAGGYITETYGQPAAGRHAVQIEINRALYMDERAIRKLPQLPTALAEALLAAAAALGGAAQARRDGLRLAAE